MKPMCIGLSFKLIHPRTQGHFGAITPPKVIEGIIIMGGSGCAK